MSSTPDPQLSTVVLTNSTKFKQTTVVEGLERPWSMAWLPDGLLYVLTDESDGRSIRLEP